MPLPRWLWGAAIVAAFGILSCVAEAEPSDPARRLFTLPVTDLTLSVECRQEGLLVTYTIHYENLGGSPVSSVTFHDRLPGESTFVGDPARVVDGVWTDTFRNVAHGPHALVLAVRLNASIADSDPIVNLVTMQYASGGQSVTKTYEHEFRASFPPATPPTPEIPVAATFPLGWLMAAPAAAGALAGLAALGSYRRTRRPRFEQVFLMHRSGMLIHHWGQGASPSSDLDILSARFVILKEFVRDSFREKSGGLTEMQFGESHLLLAEGQHAVLATVIEGGRMNGLPGQIQAAVRDFEGRNLAALPDWTGQVEVLDGASEVVENLVQGRYGSLRRAT